jgi:hypothetical protein
MGLGETPSTGAALENPPGAGALLDPETAALVLAETARKNPGEAFSLAFSLVFQAMALTLAPPSAREELLAPFALGAQAGAALVLGGGEGKGALLTSRGEGFLLSGEGLFALGDPAGADALAVACADKDGAPWVAFVNGLDHRVRAERKPGEEGIGALVAFRDTPLGADFAAPGAGAVAALSAWLAHAMGAVCPGAALGCVEALSRGVPAIRAPQWREALRAAREETAAALALVCLCRDIVAKGFSTGADPDGALVRTLSVQAVRLSKSAVLRVQAVAGPCGLKTGCARALAVVEMAGSLFSAGCGLGRPGR